MRILSRLKSLWNLPADRFMHVPNIFVTSAQLLSLDPDVQTNLITFLGRLEVRKGVIELAQAIPKVVAEVPEAVFRFVGRSLPHPGTREDLKSYLSRMLRSCARSVEFIEGVPNEEIPALLAETDLCVFPSVWESSGYVCKEAMAAARGVIGSRAGGMAEIIEQGRTGLLVPPRDPKEIAAAIVRTLKEPERRIAMGRAARAHVLKTYSADRIAPLQESLLRPRNPAGKDPQFGTKLRLMQNLALTVVICTHDPREDYLALTLDALKRQTLDQNEWELLIVDNGSSRPLEGCVDLHWQQRARVVREERLGLFHARVRSFHEANGEKSCVFGR